MADSDSPILEVLSTPQEQFTHLMAFSALLVMADVQQKHFFVFDMTENECTLQSGLKEMCCG